MKIQILKTEGISEALLALGLSYGKTSEIDYDEFRLSPTKQDVMMQIAEKLCDKDGGHNSFLELINVWVDIDAPRYWWQEMDRYRVGKVQLSESTMHTLNRGVLFTSDFEGGLVMPEVLAELNYRIKENYSVESLKILLPEGFLQRRILCINYKCLRNILRQRKDHKLACWRYFCDKMKKLPNYKLLGIKDE